MSSGPHESAGWFPDPTGRFGRRHWDGHRWSDHVVAADGNVITDALPADGPPLAPPAATPASALPPAPPASRPTAPPPGHAPPGYAPGWQPGPAFQPGPVTSPARPRPGWGLAIGGTGLLMVLLSLLVVPWSDAEKSRFTDLSSAFRDAGSGAVDDAVLYTYVAYGAFVLLVLLIGLVVATGIPLARSSGGRSTLAVVGAVVAALAVSLHGYLLHQTNVDAITSSAGGWLGLGGFALAGIGVVVGARSAPAVPGSPRTSPTVGRAVGGVVVALGLVAALGFAGTEADVDSAPTVAGGSVAGGDRGSSSDSGATTTRPSAVDLPSVEKLTTSFPLPAGAKRGAAQDYPPAARDGWVQYFWQVDRRDVNPIKKFYDRKLPGYGVQWDPVEVTSGTRTAAWLGSFPTAVSDYGGQLDVEEVNFTDGSRVVQIRLQVQKR